MTCPVCLQAVRMLDGDFVCSGCEERLYACSCRPHSLSDPGHKPLTAGEKIGATAVLLAFALGVLWLVHLVNGRAAL